MHDHIFLYICMKVSNNKIVILKQEIQKCLRKDKFVTFQKISMLLQSFTKIKLSKVMYISVIVRLIHLHNRLISIVLFLKASNWSIHSYYINLMCHNSK